MVTDKVKVDGWGIGMDDALELTEKFAEYKGLDHKTALRLRLLTEESLSMVTAIAEDFDAQFWIECTSDNVAKIHLMAVTDMDYNKKQELIAASKNKSNQASVGFMGKIRELIEDSIYTMDEVGRLQTASDGSSFKYSTMGVSDVSMLQADDFMWSLELYRANVDKVKSENMAARAAWDELEKSIVANIADDVKVSVKGNNVELVIEKKLSE